MRAELFTPAGGGPVPEGWDAFVRDLRACVLWEADLLEVAAWGSPRPLFAGLVREAGEPVAAFCGRLGVRPLALRFRPPGRAAVPGWFQVHVPNSFSPGRLYAPGLDTAGRRAATRAFEREVRRRLGPRCLGIVHLDADTSELSYLGGPLRWRRATSPNAVLHNRWESMDAYFAGLPRGRRRRLSALHQRVGADPELVVESAVPVIDPVHASRLDQLTRMKHTGRPGRVVPLLPAYFDRLNRSPGASYFAHRDKNSGRPVSFDLVLDAPGGWLTTVTGSDGGRDLYLDLYLREIDRLIATGVPAVELGPGMRQLKESFGATAVPRHAVAVPF